MVLTYCVNKAFVKPVQRSDHYGGPQLTAVPDVVFASGATPLGDINSDGFFDLLSHDVTIHMGSATGFNVPTILDSYQLNLVQKNTRNFS